MSEKAGYIAVRIAQSSSGLFTATSNDLPGVFVAHRDIDKIADDMPAIIQRWFKHHRGLDVTVLSGPLQKFDDSFGMLANCVPAEIAAQALGR